MLHLCHTTDPPPIWGAGPLQHETIRLSERVDFSGMMTMVSLLAEPQPMTLPFVGEPAYAWSMTPTAAEVLDAAKALPREQRAEVVQKIIATLGTPDIADESRRATLRAAVDAGIASLDAGDGVRVPADGVREYLRERGQLATARANAKTA